MKALKKEFDLGNAFAAVGAGHLFGEYGLISLLEKQGYKVQRLTQDPRPNDQWIRRAR